MSDYISKDELKERLVYCRGLGRTSLEAVLKAMDNTPTLSETEIIRKYGEQILNEFYGKHAEYRRLSEQANMELPQECYYNGHTKGFEEAIEIVKEECGINE